MQLAMSISPIPGVPHESTQLIMSHIIWQESDLCWMPKRPLWPWVFIFDTNYATSQSVLEHRASHTQKYTFINILYSISCCFKSGFFFLLNKKKKIESCLWGFIYFVHTMKVSGVWSDFHCMNNLFLFWGGGGLQQYTNTHNTICSVYKILTFGVNWWLVSKNDR